MARTDGVPDVSVGEIDGPGFGFDPGPVCWH
jgi:hypothetical protein